MGDCSRGDAVYLCQWFRFETSGSPYIGIGTGFFLQFNGLSMVV